MSPSASPNPDEIPSTGKLFSSAEIIELSEYASRRAEKLGTVIEDLEKGIAAKADAAARSAAAAGFPPVDQDTARKKVASKARGELAQSSSDTRWGYIEEVSAAGSATDLTATLFATPLAVLARSGLGTPERTNYQVQLKGAGNVELRNMAAFAVATENRALGAAVVSVVERMPRRERPLNPADLADRLVGEETRRVQNAIAKIKLAAATARNLNTEFETGKRDGLGRMKLALQNREVS